MGMEHAILIDWDDKDYPYPLRIIVKHNRQGISYADRYNEDQVGFGIFCSPEMDWWMVKADNPCLPEILYLFWSFFRKPKNVKCRLKWIRYCWLKLKEWAMFRKRFYYWIPYDHLWSLRTFDGKLMIFKDQEEIPKEIDQDSMTQYRWRRAENAYVIYKPEPMTFERTLVAMSTLVHGSC